VAAEVPIARPRSRHTAEEVAAIQDEIARALKPRRDGGHVR
jgi:hypothetical protein